MSTFSVHAEGTPNESFFIPLDIFRQMYIYSGVGTRLGVCFLCPYSEVQSGEPNCKSQCEAGIGRNFVLARKGLWTAEMDDLFIRYSLKGTA